MSNNSDYADLRSEEWYEVVTLFPDLNQGSPSRAKLDTVLNRIRNGKSKEKVLKLREMTSEMKLKQSQNPEWVRISNLIASEANPKEVRKLKKELNIVTINDEPLMAITSEREKLKKTLVSVLFSGTFTIRNDNYMVYHSGYIIIDIDEVDSPEFYKQNMFENFEYIRAAWISPSGTGVKLLVKVPPVIKDHRGRFQALKKIFVDLDPSGINESRICFESFDEHILIREEEDTEFFEGWEMPDEAIELSVGENTKKTAYKTDYSIVQRIVSMIRGAIPGERNMTVLRACRLAGGYIAKGSIVEEEIIGILESECFKIFGSEYEDEKHTIENGIKYGKEKPIHELEEESIVNEETHDIINIFDVAESIFDQWKNGIRRGTPLYIHEIDEMKVWSRKPGRVGIFTGLPESGKSEILKQIYLLQAIHEGAKSVVYGPEEEADEFYGTLLHTLIGKEVVEKNVSKKMVQKAMEFIRDHIFYVYPKGKHTVDLVFANFVFMAKKMKIRNFCIDPITKLTYSAKDRDDKVLGEFYTRCDFFAREFNCNLDVGVHPHTMKLNKDGEYDPPNIYDVAGGATTSNMVHDFVSVSRPNKNKDPLDTTVILIFRKIKNRKTIGNGMSIELNFDKFQNRYYSGGKCYVGKWTESKQEELDFGEQENLTQGIIPLLPIEPHNKIINNFEKEGENFKKEIMYGPDDEFPF